MPIIANVDPQEIQSPVRSLLRPFQSCPFAIAPERESELELLRDKHKLRLTLDATRVEFVYWVSSMMRTVWVGLPTLERLWAYAYAYYVFFELHREVGMGVEVKLAEHPSGSKARTLLLWAMDGEFNGHLGRWPDEAPTPETSADQNVAPANELFLLMNGWIFLHELAHLELNHDFSQTLSPEKSITQESQADDWASHWILDRWQAYKADEAIFIKRTLEIAFALAAFSGMEYYEEAKTKITHPSSHARLLHFLDTFVGREDPRSARRSEAAWYAATAILSAHLLNSRKDFDPKISHATFRDFILYAGTLLAAEPTGTFTTPSTSSP